jgi:uncharacterized protein
MASATQILEVLRANREHLRRLGVRRLGLFGSAARGEATEASDLDFLVEFDRKSFDAYMDVKELLEQLFGRRVDLVLAEAVKPQLKKGIFAETIYAEGLWDIVQNKLPELKQNIERILGA